MPDLMKHEGSTPKDKPCLPPTPPSLKYGSNRQILSRGSRVAVHGSWKDERPNGTLPTVWWHIRRVMLLIARTRAPAAPGGWTILGVRGFLALSRAGEASRADCFAVAFPWQRCVWVLR